MSRMIPRESIDVLREYVDISLTSYGIDCTLYIPTNTSYAVAEKLDVFATPSDYSFLSYSAKVFIQWTPNIWRLKKLGLFTEGQVPILAYFPNKVIALEGSEAGSEVEVDIVKTSYIKILPEYIPEDQKGVEEFEVVNVGTPNMQDAVITKLYSLVPRRVKH
jgi:hypothetical protein